MSIEDKALAMVRMPIAITPLVAICEALHEAYPKDQVMFVPHGDHVAFVRKEDLPDE